MLGVAPGVPLPIADGLIDDGDRAEASALLGAVVDHWTALRRTSVEALRATFLRRRGLLDEPADGPRLRVELGPFDALLDRLPWPISVVKLPWTARPLFVEWPTR
jgi:hypothetical protein